METKPDLTPREKKQLSDYKIVSAGKNHLVGEGNSLSSDTPDDKFKTTWTNAQGQELSFEDDGIPVEPLISHLNEKIDAYDLVIADCSEGKENLTRDRNVLDAQRDVLQKNSIPLTELGSVKANPQLLEEWKLREAKLISEDPLRRSNEADEKKKQDAEYFDAEQVGKDRRILKLPKKPPVGLGPAIDKAGNLAEKPPVSMPEKKFMPTPVDIVKADKLARSGALRQAFWPIALTALLALHGRLHGPSLGALPVDAPPMPGEIPPLAKTAESAGVPETQKFLVTHRPKVGSSLMGLAQYEAAKTDPQVAEKLKILAQTAPKEALTPVELDPSDPVVVEAVSRFQQNKQLSDAAYDAFINSVRVNNPDAISPSGEILVDTLRSEPMEQIIQEVTPKFTVAGVQ